MSQRSAQMLVAALGALLIVVVGATIFILLTRPPAVGPSPLPTWPVSFPPPSLASPTLPATALAVEKASAAPIPTLTPTPTPTLSLPPTALVTSEPTASPTLEPTPTPSLPPTPSPTPTPIPTVNPTAPERRLALLDIGLDDKSLEGSVPRVVTFEVDGQSLLRAQVSGASGPVQLCLWREAVNDERTCHTAHSVTLQHAVLDAGSSIWHASVIGASGTTPTASLAVTFNTNLPNVQLDNFRYLGAASPGYNGFEAVVATGAAGDLSVQASFDGPEAAYDYHLVIQPQDGDPILDQTGGPSESVDQSQPVDGGTMYHVILGNPDQLSSPNGPVFVAANLMWP